MKRDPVVMGDGAVVLYCGDCRDVLPTMEAESVHSIVTDPPYGLGFMGKHWDHGVPGVDFWTAALRVAKPGAHLLAFGGTRTFHRLAVAIEDAGWELRDTIGWLYGSGFPKSHNVANGIDKAQGCSNRGRAIPAASTHFPSGRYAEEKLTGNKVDAYEARTEAGKPWQGWGTALKPAWEPIIVARKPFPGTVAANVLAHGTGAINVDGCRVGTDAGDNPTALRRSYGYTPNEEKAKDSEARGALRDRSDPIKKAMPNPSDNLGRWPANLIHDGSDEVVGLFPVSTSGASGKASVPRNPIRLQSSATVNHIGHSDTGSAARFFYVAKCSKADREGSKHPTMKPTKLMQYLCRLVTPPGGVVLDPFMGSGSTGKGAILEGFRFVGIDREAEYVEISKVRIEYALQQRRLEL